MYRKNHTITYCKKRKLQFILEKSVVWFVSLIHPEIFRLEDKDTKVIWGHNSHCFVLLWLTMRQGQHDRWKVSSLTQRECVDRYRKVLATFVPKFLKDTSGRFHVDNIPVMHASVKRKCFKSDLDFNSFGVPTCLPKACRKANHSCYRNIVSFFHFPFKKLWRSIARAVRNVTDEVISTWSISNMSRSSEHLKAGHAKLMTSATRLLCSCTLEYPTNHTWASHKHMTRCITNVSYRILRES